MVTATRTATGISGVSVGTSALRPLNLPAPVAVTERRDGIPARVLWKGRQRRVTAVLDHWRIDDEWWRLPVRRYYYELVLDDEHLLIVFRDILNGGWFTQRLPHRGGPPLR